MNEKHPRYQRTLKRLLNELAWAISNRNAYNALYEVAPRTSWGFFSFAAVALKNDMYSHTMKVLDQHEEACSFNYITNCRPKAVYAAIENASLTIDEIIILSDKLKSVRDKTHFHIDKKAVFFPESVWKKADIKGDNFNKILDGLWKIINALYLEEFGSPFIQSLYEGEEITSIINRCREVGIKV